MRRFRPQINELENRSLLCVVVLGTTAIIQGTEGNDKLVVTQDDSGTLTANINGAETVLPENIQTLYFTGDGGNDKITNDTYLEAAIHGGAGNDKLVGGVNVDYLFGDEGNDNIIGDSSFDYIQEDPFSPDEPPLVLGTNVFFFGNNHYTVNYGDPGTLIVNYNGGDNFVPDFYNLVFDGGTVTNNTDVGVTVLDEC